LTIENLDHYTSSSDAMFHKNFF